MLKRLIGSVMRAQLGTTTSPSERVTGFGTLSTFSCVEKTTGIPSSPATLNPHNTLEPASLGPEVRDMRTGSNDSGNRHFAAPIINCCSVDFDNGGVGGGLQLVCCYVEVLELFNSALHNERSGTIFVD